MSYGDALCLKGLIPAEVLARVREGSGYRDLAEDLIVLVEQFQGLPGSLTGDGSVVTGADLTRASEVANQIFLYVGDEAVETSQALEDERRKLGGLLGRAHHQVRRGVSHFRWDEGDVNTFVPSIYVPPGARKSTTASTTDVPPDLATLHEELHAAQGAVGAPTPMGPEDHPSPRSEGGPHPVAGPMDGGGDGPRGDGSAGGADRRDADVRRGPSVAPDGWRPPRPRCPPSAPAGYVVAVR